ncbi:inosine/xanthosine triphosphatase [Rossellomorea marisflavi]
MKDFGVGTTNPAKVSAIQKAIGPGAVIHPVEAESGVSAQPFSDEETIRGAVNRARNSIGTFHVGIGLEGGVVDTTSGLFLCNWGALVDAEGREYIAGGARILLPDELADDLRGGMELGPLMDAYTKREGVRHQEGAVGVFTNGLVTREAMFIHVVILLIGQWEYAQIKQDKRCDT